MDGIEDGGDAMPETSNSMEELQDEAYVMRVIDEMGGARAILDDLGEFRQLVDRDVGGAA